jgi:hypothetical protein
LTRLLAWLGFVVVPRRLVPALLDSLVTYKLNAEGLGNGKVSTICGGTYADAHEAFRLLTKGKP